MTQQLLSRINLPKAVPIIIIINIAVFFIWNFISPPDTEPIFMVRHFLVSYTALLDGRLWVLITSAFSHIAFLHLFMNLFVLNSFGPIVESTIGTVRFIKFYFFAAIISSASHAFVSAWILGKPDLPALGASGAIAGIILLFSLIFPKQKILIFGLIPIPAIWGVFVFAGLDIWGLVAQAEGGGLPIGHGAHLGGVLAGIIYYFLFIRGRI